MHSGRLLRVFAAVGSLILGCQLIALECHAAEGKANRLAVVIANSSYANIGELRNPVQDAELVSEAFRKVGFQVQVHDNLSESQFRKLTRDLAKSTPRFDVTVVYYAGHGVQISGINYLLPVDLPPPESEDDVRLASISADDVLSVIKSPYKVVVLDACRDNPVVSRGISRGRSISVKRGLAPPTAPEMSEGGIFIAYSTQADAVAVDGDGKYSPFADSFAAHVGSPGSIDDMFALVTRDVLKATNGLQRPFKYASLDSIFCLTGTCGSVGVTPLAMSISTIPPSSSLADDIKKLDGLPESSVGAIQLSSQLRKQYFSRFASVARYGSTAADAPSPAEYGFEPASVVLRGNDVTVNVRSRPLSHSTADWDSAISEYRISCTERFGEVIAVIDGDSKALFPRAEREKRRVAAAPGSILESLANIVCPGVVSTTPIPGPDETDWVSVGSRGRSAGDTAAIAPALTRLSRTDPEHRYVTLRSQKSFDSKGAEIPNERQISLIELDCRGNRFRMVADYTESEKGIDAAIGNVATWTEAAPGSVVSNAMVLVCEAR